MQNLLTFYMIDTPALEEEVFVVICHVFLLEIKIAYIYCELYLFTHFSLVILSPYSVIKFLGSVSYCMCMSIKC